MSFPGIGNTIETDIPIEITSGLTTPSADDAAPPYDGPPAALDSPPYVLIFVDFGSCLERYSFIGHIGLPLGGKTAITTRKAVVIANREQLSL